MRSPCRNAERTHPRKNSPFCGPPGFPAMGSICCYTRHLIFASFLCSRVKFGMEDWIPRPVKARPGSDFTMGHPSRTEYRYNFLFRWGGQQTEQDEQQVVGNTIWPPVRALRVDHSYLTRQSDGPWVRALLTTMMPSQTSESLLHRLAGPSTGKAGLAKDQTEINRVIAEASKGSRFYEVGFGHPSRPNRNT